MLYSLSLFNRLLAEFGKRVDSTEIIDLYVMITLRHWVTWNGDELGGRGGVEGGSVCMFYLTADPIQHPCQISKIRYITASVKASLSFLFVIKTQSIKSTNLTCEQADKHPAINPQKSVGAQKIVDMPLSSAEKKSTNHHQCSAVDQNTSPYIHKRA